MVSLSKVKMFEMSRKFKFCRIKETFSVDFKIFNRNQNFQFERQNKYSQLKKKFKKYLKSLMQEEFLELNVVGGNHDLSTATRPNVKY